jgi:hypothetical protein
VPPPNSAYCRAGGGETARVAVYCEGIEVHSFGVKGSGCFQQCRPHYSAHSRAVPSIADTIRLHYRTRKGPIPRCLAARGSGEAGARTMSTIPDPAQRGTLIALEPRIRAAFHPLYHEIARRKDLTAGAKLVYAVLCSYHQMFSDVFPGRERLAADTGLSAHQLVDETKSLVDAALLHVKRRGFGQTNVYTLLRWPASPDIPRGISDVQPGIYEVSQGNDIPIEEEEQKDPETIWQEAKETLRLGTTAANYTTYIEGTQGLRIDRGELVVGVPSRSQLRALNERWRATAALAARMPVRFEG